MVYLRKKHLRQHLFCIQIQNEVTHVAGIHRVYVPKKTKSTVFFNNRHIVSFIESCCGKSTVIQNEAKKDALEKSSSSQQNK